MIAFGNPPGVLRLLVCVLAWALLTGTGASPAIAAHHKTACIACCACKHYTKVRSDVCKRVSLLLATVHPSRNLPIILSVRNIDLRCQHCNCHSMSLFLMVTTHTHTGRGAGGGRVQTARTATAATVRMNSAGTRTIRRRTGVRNATAWLCRVIQGARRVVCMCQSDRVAA